MFKNRSAEFRAGVATLAFFAVIVLCAITLFLAVEFVGGKIVFWVVVGAAFGFLAKMVYAICLVREQQKQNRD